QQAPRRRPARHQHQDPAQHAAAVGAAASPDSPGGGMIGAMRPNAREPSQYVRAQLDRLEEAAARLTDGPGRALFVESVRGLREAIERRDETEHDQRHQLGHHLAVPLNATAGWAALLRLDATTATTVTRAVEVFDRNVRALTRLIEGYTS